MMEKSLIEQKYSDIESNLKHIREEIAEAAVKSGRKPEDIDFMAVTKTVDEMYINHALDSGITLIGENKVQELCDKYDVLPKDLHWHMIGHLQRNKVKYITDKVDLIHSVDSLRLAEAISEDAVKKGIQVNILVEVNVAEEASKFGFKVEETENLIRSIAKLPNIHIQGLMTIAPYTENPEDNRPVFRTLKQLSVDIERKNIDNVSMSVLSMGMTGDYEVAIEEGATYVRVGTGIFGERDYNKNN